MALLDEIQVRVYRSYVKIPLIFFVPALTLMSVFSLTYFHVNSPHFWRAVEGQLHEVMGGHFSLGYVEMGPTLTAVDAYRVDMMTPQREPVISVDRLQAAVNPLMLIAKRLEFDQGEVDGARVRLEFDDGKLNLLEALGYYERQEVERSETEAREQAVGFSDITIRDAEFEFVDQRFGFSVDDVEIPRGSVFIEPATILMSVDEVMLPRADFWFHPELFRFPSERGDWEFTARDFHIENWQWANKGFTVDRVSTEVDGIRAEAQGRMVFPGDDQTMLYDATGTIEADYNSTVLEYFTNGNIRFDIPKLDVEVAGDLNEIQGRADAHARIVEATGVFFRDLRGELVLDNRFLRADGLTGRFYGGELRAENAFFNMLETSYGADLFVDGVEPRSMIEDMVGQDQPFLEGAMSGGLRIIGEIPTAGTSPRPENDYVLMKDANAKYAQMEVIENLRWSRNQDLLFPNQNLELLQGSQFWIDQRRLGLPTATARSGADRFEVRDFFLSFGSMGFETVGGAGPAKISGSIDEMAPYATYYGLDGLEGPAQMAMTMDGFFGSPQWSLRASMDEPTWRLSDDEVLAGERIELELEGENGDIVIERAIAETDFGNFDAAGRVGWFMPPPADDAQPPFPIWEDRRVQPLDLQVDAQQLEMAVVSPLIHPELEARGKLDGSTDLQGTLQNLSGDFEARFGDGTIREQAVRGASVTGGFEAGGVRVDDARLDLGTAGLFSGKGRYGYDGDFWFDLDGEQIELAELRELQALPMQLGGKARFYMSGEGNVDEPLFSAGAQTRELSIDGRVFGDVALAADTVDDIVYISGGLLPWLTASIEIPLRGQAPYYARFGMEELEVMDFLPELRAHPMLDEARATGTTELFIERDFSRHQAIFNLNRLTIDSRGQEVTNQGPIIVGYNNGEVLTFQRATFQSGGRFFSLEGAMGLDPTLLDLRVEGDFDLSLLQSVRAGFPDFFPEFFVDAEGYTNVDMNIRGTPERFVADGSILFGPSQWELRFLPEPVALTGGQMNFGDYGIEIPDHRPVEGTLLGGATRLTGTIGYLADQAREMDLRMWSHNMSYRIPDLATLAFDTNLQIRASDWQDWRQWLISGDVDILDGVYEQEFNIVEQEIAGRVMGAFQPQTSQYEAGLLEAVPILEDIGFDLHIRARDGFMLRSQLDRLAMDLELRFDLLLQNTLANPRLNGDVDVIDGLVSFQGEAFEVRSGVVRFSGDVGNPYLDIQAGADVTNTCGESDFMDEVSPSMTLSSTRADTEQQYYHIMMNLEGELEHLNLQMESRPYADQRDILSLLLTGCTVDELTATGASRPTLEVALGPLLGRLEREIQDVVAVDEFTITPGVERTQVRIGDSLFRRLDWRFQLDTGFTDATGGQQFQLEYKYSDRWTAEPSVRSHMETNDFLIDMKLNYRLPLD